MAPGGSYLFFTPFYNHTWTLGKAWNFLIIYLRIFPLPCSTGPLSYWVQVPGHPYLESCSSYRCFPWFSPCLENVISATDFFFIFSNIHANILTSCKSPNVALQMIQNPYRNILSELRTFHYPISVFLTTPTNPPLTPHSGISTCKVYFFLRVFN